MSGERLLVVDDDLSLRQFLSLFLRREGYDVEDAPSAEVALSQVESRWPDLVITDLTMPGRSGVELMRELKARAAREARDLEVVVISAYGSTAVAVEAMRDGAADYVCKPFNNDELRMVIRRALNRRALEAENARLRQALKAENNFGNLVGASESMHAVYDLIRRVKDTRINCLILGESGTGKEMVARAIHYSGVRADGPFVAVNCGAIPATLVESELFGYKRGAFTGANQDKAGLMKAADGGTIFLDEVVSLPQQAQVSLLRALQERRFTPVGDTREVAVDVRIIAACNVNLEESVEKGEFREDLYYRLNVVQINLPPLRERREDIPALVKHFLGRFTAEYGKRLTIAEAARRALERWHYPGNVRELQNVVERAVALAAGPSIEEGDLPARLRRDLEPDRGGAVELPEGFDLDVRLADEERRWLNLALERAEGNKTLAAQLLGLTFRSFRYRLAKHNLAQDG